MKRFCPNCLQEQEVREVKREEMLSVKGVPIPVQAVILTCNVCNEEVFDKEYDGKNLERAYEEYRRQKGLLPPEKMRTIREKYRLSQAAFAKVLGLGEKTVTRYENGSIPDEAPNNLILLAEDDYCMAKLFEKNRSKLSRTEIDNANITLVTKGTSFEKKQSYRIELNYTWALQDEGVAAENKTTDIA